MRRAYRSPDRTVREEMLILERLGFIYGGTNSAGHHLWSHPAHGALRPMSSTPKNAHTWRRAHRAEVARTIGLSLFQLERLLASQPVDSKPRRRRSRHKAARRGKRPISLLLPRPLPPPAAPVAPAPPDPGSQAAVDLGCRCPVFANRRGLGLEGRDGLFEIVIGCPVHDEAQEAA